MSETQFPITAEQYCKCFDGFFFDFDGVIVESNEIKDEAFREIFKRNPETFDTAWFYHKRHNTIPRGEKFKFYCKEIRKLDDYERQSEILASEFRSVTLERIILCPEIPGAKRFLDVIKNTNKPAWISSATPTTDLEEIVERRHLTKYFKKVLGAPTIKENNLKDFIEINRFDPEKVCYFGDSIEDYKAAKSQNATFVAIPGVHNFTDYPIQIIRNFREILEPE